MRLYTGTGDGSQALSPTPRLRPLALWSPIENAVHCPTRSIRAL